MIPSSVKGEIPGSSAEGTTVQEMACWYSLHQDRNGTDKPNLEEDYTGHLKRGRR